MVTRVVTTSQGAKLKIGNGASPEVFTEILGVQDISGPDLTWNFSEQKEHGQTAPHQLRTIKTIGDVSFKLLYDSGDTQHAALLTACQAGTKKNFQLLFTDTGAEQVAFSATIGTWKMGAPVEGANTRDVSLKIDGDVTIS